MARYVLSELQLHMLSAKKFDNTKQISSACRLSSFWLGVFFAAIAAESATSALAEIRATVKNGLRTEVNGLRGGEGLLVWSVLGH